MRAGHRPGPGAWPPGRSPPAGSPPAAATRPAGEDRARRSPRRSCPPPKSPGRRSAPARRSGRRRRRLRAGACAPSRRSPRASAGDCNDPPRRMATVEITDISLLPSDDPGLDFELDDSERTSPGHHLTLTGRARAGDALTSVRVLFGGRLVGQAEAAASECSCSFGVLGLPAECELEVNVRAPGTAPTPVARVAIRRERLAIDPGGLRPVIMRTLGRSGSTWAMAVLGSHPEVVVYGAFEYEPNVARWWADVLADLAEPVTLAQWFDSRFAGSDPWWLGRNRPGPVPALAGDRPRRWLGKEAVEELAAFGARMADTFYAEAAADQGKDGAACFAEKRAPAWRATGILRELYPGLREIYLVRDFRDVLCSRLSFTRRRGVRSFGLETLRDGEGDEDYVRGYMRHEVARFYDAWQLWQDDSFLLRYEALLEEPEETIAALFSYLGVDATTETVGSVLETARELDPETKRRHQTARDDRASIGRWREDLEEPLKAAASESFGEALTGLGYER